MKLDKELLVKLIQEQIDERFQQNPKRKQPLRKNCRVTKRDVTQEYRKEGKIKKPVQVTVVTTECDLVFPK
jgi:hypothetical protein